MSVLRLDRPNPDLKDLLLASQVRIGLELKHAARKVFYVSVITIVQSTRFAQTLIKIAVAGAVLAKVRSNNRQRRPVFINARNANWKTKRDRRRASLTLHEFDLDSGCLIRPGELCGCGFAVRKF